MNMKTNARKFLEGLTGGALTFGCALAAVRKGDEISQVEFARKLGITRQNLCDIEHGRKAVSAVRAAAWAKKLGYHEGHWSSLAVQDQLRRGGRKNAHVRIEF